MYCLAYILYMLRGPATRQHSIVESDHEILSTVIIPYRLFKKVSCQFLMNEYAIIITN